MSMTRAKIESVIKKIPSLTDFGIGLFDGGRNLGRKEYEEQFKRNQEDLLESVAAFEKACEWLEQIKKIKTINRKRSSYGLKHVAEKDIGYITNGVFIAAAVHSGFEYKMYDNSPNVAFNMSEKSIKQIEKRHYSTRL